MIAAELTPNGRNAQCPECHRLLAIRSKDDDGRRRLYLDPDWRPLGPDKFARSVQRERGAMVGAGWDVPEMDESPMLGRDWERRERWYGARHGTGAKPRQRVDGPTRLGCGCGRTITLDATALDVTFEPYAG